MSRPPPSIHASFFSSVRQVEKRLKLENPPEPYNLPSLTLPKPTENVTESATQVDSLSSPIYLNFDIPNNSSVFQDSETPNEFLSDSFDFPSKTGRPSQLNSNNVNVKDPQSIDSDEDDDGLDEIESLIRLLGFSDLKKTVGFGSDDGDSQFYGKVVGVKGPKSGKEVQRLEGWIKHFLNEDGDRLREPLRLAHLLLAKAALVSGDTDDGFEGIPFPSTIEDFLHNDPPKD